MNLADNSIILILISIVFIYAVLSILVSILIEAVNYRSEARGRYLKRSIYKLLKDPLNNDYGYLFYNHFMIAGLKTFRFKLPHYISSSMFAEAFIDIIAAQVVRNQPITQVSSDATGKQYALAGTMSSPPVTNDNSKVTDRFAQSVKMMNTSPFSDLLQSFVDKSNGDYTKLKAMIEQWYNDYMDRVSGWYKSEQRTKLLVAGFAVAILLNVDSLHLLKILSLDDNMKNRLVAQAENVADQYQSLDSVQKNNISTLTKILVTTTYTTGKVSLDSASYSHLGFLVKMDSLTRDIRKTGSVDSLAFLLAQLNVPLGWGAQEAPVSWLRKKNTVTVNAATNSGVISYLQQRNEWSWGNFFRYLTGIVISGISLSFGAPFWFDILGKLVNIRRSGKRPETSTSNSSN